LNFSKVKAFEQQVEDVMELIDTTELKAKLKEVEEVFRQNQHEMNKVRLGIIYHETTLHYAFYQSLITKDILKKGIMY
jgi:hypothetical protein